MQAFLNGEVIVLTHLVEVIFVLCCVVLCSVYLLFNFVLTLNGDNCLKLSQMGLLFISIEEGGSVGFEGGRQDP